jgi:hypothetical protein
MRKVKGIAKAVVTIVGAISLSSPLLAASPNAVTQKAPLRQKDRPGMVHEEQLLFDSVGGDLSRDRNDDTPDSKT